MRSPRRSTPALRRSTRTTTTVLALASVAVLGASGPEGYAADAAPTRVRVVSAAPAPAASVTSPRSPLRYRWTQDLADLDTYSVAFVRGSSPRAALRAIGPVRRRATDGTALDAAGLSQELAGSSDSYPPVVQVYRARGGTVVLCAGCFRAIEREARLSRRGTAAAFTTTVELDTWVTVGRRGRVVRDFDPYAYDASHALPQEAGLPFGTDLDTAASWTLMQRLTGVHVSRRSFVRTPHPTYVLRGRV